METYLEWSDRYATGIGLIDRDHQTLFVMVNALHDAIVMDTEPAPLSDLFARLADYVNRHFALEEDLMQSHGYPGFEAHQEMHRELAATVLRLTGLYEQEPSTVAHEDLMEFLKGWLSHHVLTSDMDYVACVTGQTAGGGINGGSSA